ncbi:MAG: Transcription elongation factor GreA, partial [uncultured Solirubrobacteraceae bacterium]
GQRPHHDGGGPRGPAQRDRRARDDCPQRHRAADQDRARVGRSQGERRVPRGEARPVSPRDEDPPAARAAQQRAHRRDDRRRRDRLRLHRGGRGREDRPHDDLHARLAARGRPVERQALVRVSGRRRAARPAARRGRDGRDPERRAPLQGRLGLV